MHEHDATPGRAAPRPFTPRLVGGEDAPMARPAGARGVAAGGGTSPALAAQHAELHDPTVREIADSLADLFLGPEAEQARAGVDAPTDRSATVVGHTSSVGRAFTARPGRAAGSPAGAGDGGAAQRSGGVSIEMLVLGHLPVLAGAWLTQYAAQAARTLGKPVALARLEPGGLTIDMFGLPREAAVPRCETAEAAIAAARSLAGAWLVRVDDLAEATVADSPRIGAITLLSGVSESSIVAAYRALKAIVQRAGSRGAEPQREELPELRMALLGATPERAAEASVRIRKAAATFLGRPVGVIVCAERIGPSAMRTVYRGECGLGGAALLERIAGDEGGQAASRPTSAGAAVDVAQATGVGVAAAGVREAPRMLDAPAVVPAASAADQDEDMEWMLEPELAAAGVAEVEPAPVAQVSGGGGVSASAPAPVTGAGAAAVQGVESHASLLALSALPLRCPEAPRVELAMDGGGGLHAIVLDEMSAPSAGQAGRAGVAALLAAAAWARSNADLIGRAVPGVRAGEVTLHLLTRIPAAARDLLGTSVRVHLLATAAAPGTVCVGLN